MTESKREHHYTVAVEWTGNRGSGTSDYRAYGRDHWIGAGDKPAIAGSADPAFRGDPARWNPEELLLAALSSCHQLAYLHLCATAGIAVLSYRDEPSGTMVEDSASGGHFTLVVLSPVVTVRQHDDVEMALRLHHEAHARCFIANSVNFPVEHRPVVHRAI
jgi:organic hydroperoxide reductase OsmC/OhrA